MLIQLAVSMREHGRGGLLLVVPSRGQQWQESILRPITYAVVPPFTALAELAQTDLPGVPNSRWQEARRRAVDGVGGLTAVDGATVITERYELLAFGAKIVRRPGWTQVSRVMVTEPIAGTSPETVEPAQLGGTGTSPPPSSCTTKGMPSPWSLRRTATSAFSAGPPAMKWCASTGSKASCSSRTLRDLPHRLDAPRFCNWAICPVI